jgi:GxxExxY protein
MPTTTSFPLLHGEMCRKVIGVFYDVYNELGFGFPERIYHRALLIGLRSAGFATASEVSLPVWFRERVIGRFRADLLVEDQIVVELKTLPCIYPSNVIQLLNYLRSTRRDIGLLLNFGRKPRFKRVILTAEYRRKHTPKV